MAFPTHLLLATLVVASLLLPTCTIAQFRIGSNRSSVYDIDPNGPPLQQPRVVSSDTDTLKFILDLDVANVSVGSGITLRTRAFNRTVPGFTISLKLGQRLDLLYRNRLFDNGQSPYHNNTFSAANQSNLHLHGLHIDGDWPSDSITRVVYPRQSAGFTTKILGTQLPGTHWLHPHRHGSTYLQVSGGAAAAIIIEEQLPVEGGGWAPMPVAPGVDGAPEVVLVFQPIYKWNNTNNSYKDDLFQVHGAPVDQQFTLVNGQVKPVLTITQRRWTRLRLVNTAWALLHFNFSIDGCEQVLLSKDGIYVTDFPRPIAGALVPNGGRADVMVRCNDVGDFAMLGYPDLTDVVAATVVVEESSRNWPTLGKLQVDLAAFSDYLHDTLNDTIEENCHCDTQLGFNGPNRSAAVNELPYLYLSRLHRSVLGKTAQRNLSAKAHPYHQHVIPFQLKEVYEVDENPAVPGTEPYFKVGDWHDVWRGNGLLRFTPTRFTGKMILHCHRLDHEDLGMMATEEMVRDGECMCSPPDAKVDRDEVNKVLLALAIAITLLVIAILAALCYKCVILPARRAAAARLPGHSDEERSQLLH